MKTVLITLVACVFACVSAKAQPFVRTQDLAVDSASQCDTISLDATNAINVATNTASGALTGAFGIEVYNLSTSTSAICRLSSSATTAPSLSINENASTFGRKIPADTPVYFAIKTGALSLFCRSSGGTIRATICQLGGSTQ